MQVYFNLFYIVYIRYRGKLKCKQNQKHWGLRKIGSAVAAKRKTRNFSTNETTGNNAHFHAFR